MLEVRRKVNVNSKFMSGSGIILDISNAAYYPVQVEMDQPDEDGHKIFRFHHAEVSPVCKQASTPGEHTVEVIKLIPGYSLKVGECFSAKPTSKDNGTHYLIYSENKLRGCFPVNHFRTITMAGITKRSKEKQQAAKQDNVSFNKKSYVAVKEKGKVTVYETKEADEKFHSKQKKASNHFEQMEQEGQTSIFEFI